jgi:cathepsin L
MQSLLFVLLATVVAVSALSESEYQNEFNLFRSKYEKNYGPSEAVYRYGVFKANLDFINAWDEEARGFKVAMNKFGDLTSVEFNAMYNRLNITRTPTYVAPVAVGGATVDWRTKGAVTGVKDQGQCGSCWSFSATGSMEAAHFFKTGTLKSLSEQNLVDCSTAQGNQGCNGGLMDQAFQYVISNNGIDSEESYPYTATGPNDCKYKSANSVATMSSFNDVPSGDENSLQSFVTKAPTSVAIDASQSSFQFYSSGVYYEPNCSSDQLDHGVLAVGYGVDGSNAYWIVKNSWGGSWGQQGYIWMSKGRNNNCGIATAASAPVA